MLPKYLLLAGLLALAAPGAFAQQPILHAQPLSDDDTLVLTLPDEGQTAWLRVARVLATRGYAPRTANADLLTLRTEFTGIEKAGFISLFVLVEGNRALLRAYQVTSTEGNGDVMQAARQGGFLGGASREWTEVEAVARLLGTPVGYYESAAR